MEKQTKHPSDEPILVELFVSGQGSREDKAAALQIMLDRVHPAAISNGKEVYFLEKFEVLEDL